MDVHVLFIANFPHLLEQTFAFLKKRDWVTSHASNLKDAIAIIAEKDPSHIFISYQLQNVSAAKIAQVITTKFAIPCVVFPESLLEPKEKLELSSKGIKHFVSEPLSGANVQMKVRKIIAESEKTPTRLRSPKESLEKTEETKTRMPASPSSIPPDAEWQPVGSEDGLEIWLMKKKNQIRKGSIMIFKGEVPPEWKNSRWIVSPNGQLFYIPQHELSQIKRESLMKMFGGEQKAEEQKPDRVSEISRAAAGLKNSKMAKGEAQSSSRSPEPSDKNLPSKLKAFKNNNKTGVRQSKFGKVIQILPAKKKDYLSPLYSPLHGQKNLATALKKQTALHFKNENESADLELSGSQSALAKRRATKNKKNNHQAAFNQHEEFESDSPEQKGEESTNQKFMKRFKQPTEKSADKSQTLSAAKKTKKLKIHRSSESEKAENASIALKKSEQKAKNLQARSEKPNAEDDELPYYKIRGQRRRSSVYRDEKEKTADSGNAFTDQKNISHTNDLIDAKNDESSSKLSDIRDSATKNLMPNQISSPDDTKNSKNDDKTKVATATKRELPEAEEPENRAQSKRTEEKERKVSSQEVLKKAKPGNRLNLEEKKEIDSVILQQEKLQFLVRNRVKILGHQAHSAFAQFVIRAMETEIISPPKGVTPVALRDVTHIDCVPVKSESFKGLLILSTSSDQYLQNDFAKNFKNNLLQIMKDEGQQMEDEQELPLKVQPFSFLDVTAENGEFVTLAHHNLHELGLSYIKNDGIFPILPKANQENMIEVKIENVDTTQDLKFDAYIHLPQNNKYIKYVRKGGRIDEQQKKNLTEKEVKSFFIKNDDLHSFRGHCASAFVERMVRQFLKIIRTPA
jgi:DNA-binding NarL/FixJ family response regulator